MNVLDFKVKNRQGELVELNKYKGKVLLIINSATECGFTPQYDEIENIYEKYNEKGFTVLDFPCNQFGNQAPGSNEEINSFCKMKFGVKFPIFSKIDVNGENADPLFKYLVSQKEFKGFNKEHELYEILNTVLSAQDKDYINNPSIKWNFTKFVIDRSGNVVDRFEPTEDMKNVCKSIESVL